MAVTFSPAFSTGTGFQSQSTFTLAMSGVVSGQPIIIGGYCGYGDFNSLSPSFSDNFATPYTYTPIADSLQVSGGGYVSCALYIATGGAGVSGTITLTILPYCYYFLYAVVCSGASTLPGINAIDEIGSTQGNSIIQNSPSLTPSYANEGAVYLLSSLSQSPPPTPPGSPWTVSSTVGYASIATYSNPTNGSALATTWSGGTTNYYASAGLIVHAAGYTPTSIGLLASLI